MEEASPDSNSHKSSLLFELHSILTSTQSLVKELQILVALTDPESGNLSQSQANALDSLDQSNVTLSKLASSDAAELSDTSSLSDSDPEDSTTHFDAEVENLSSGEPSPDRDPLGYVGSSSREPFFQLKGGSAGFSTRSQSIFDCLESAAKLATPGLSEDNVIDGAFVRPMPPLLSQRKKEERREAAPGKPLSKTPGSSVGMPESPTHTARWTKYSLEDVPETSDRKNSEVALEYIQSLQQKKRAIDAQEPFVPAFNQDHSSSAESKILFSRPSRRGEGQATKDKTSEDRKPEGARKKEVDLFHLEDPEEEAKTAQPGTEHGKRKWTEEEGEGDDAQQQAAVGFNCGRKINRKNFRRGAEKGEDD
ncbi:hypothetical protein AAFF_G00322140 [Aldrovandia affinis]|uniref:Protein TSSC4 n=1 Tax=Aldrovandia affinis TaxID=143900 RepID=A0AAD7WQG1_9TELE|nr:hypothetical protein AAFF_G00322140 [Aldrovandia affinis]